MTVHSILPDQLTTAVASELDRAGVGHVAHGLSDPTAAAGIATADPTALALIGPYRSADIAEATEATAPAGLALLAPVATWVGVTRDDEPGADGPQYDEPAIHRGTVLRLIARDTVVAVAIAAHVAGTGRRAFVVAGDHEYGRQLDDQLTLAGLARAPESEADVVVLAGLAGHEEIERAAATAPRPLIAFDGVQGSALGDREIRIALPHEPVGDVSDEDVLAGVDYARQAAALVVAAISLGATDRPSMLAALRRIGAFDEHGDPLDPPVWLWRADAGWSLTPDQPLQ